MFREKAHGVIDLFTSIQWSEIRETCTAVRAPQTSKIDEHNVYVRHMLNFREKHSGCVFK